MQRDRRFLGLGVIAATLLVVVAGLSCGPPPEPVEPVSEPPPEPTARFGLPMESIDGVTYIVHPRLGFRLSHPGPQFVWDEDIETRICTSMQTELTVECYALADPVTGTIFTIQINRVPSADAADFPEFHQGLVGGLGEQMTIARQEVSTDDAGRPVSRILALGTGEGVSVYAQTHPLIDQASGQHYAVSVFVYGSDPVGISSLDISYDGP